MLGSMRNWHGLHEQRWQAAPRLGTAIFGDPSVKVGQDPLGVVVVRFSQNVEIRLALYPACIVDAFRSLHTCQARTGPGISDWIMQIYSKTTTQIDEFGISWWLTIFYPSRLLLQVSWFSRTHLCFYQDVWGVSSNSHCWHIGGIILDNQLTLGHVLHD